MYTYLDKDLMEKMCHRLAVVVFDTEEEPIAKFEDHELSLLDSALNAPKQTFDQKDLYPSLEEKAAILYYSLNKNHPFKNGNKRIATASLLVFLFLNDKWLDMPMEKLLEQTLRVAQSKPKERDTLLVELHQWIRDHLVNA
jgi:death-on-curing protein